MTTTTQALSGQERADYKKILAKFKTKTAAEQEQLRKEQAEIVLRVVRNNSSVQDDIAEEVRIRILNNPDYNT